MASAYSLHSEVMGLNPDKGFLTRYSRTAHLIKMLCNVVLVYLLDPDYAYLSLLSTQAAQLSFFLLRPEFTVAPVLLCSQFLQPYN